jgi:hypothetical protein
MDKIKEYKIKLGLVISMLKPCECPVCDGSGTIPQEIMVSGSGWEDDGYGNPVQIQVPIQDWELIPCEWCYTKEQLIRDYSDE